MFNIIVANSDELNQIIFEDKDKDDGHTNRLDNDNTALTEFKTKISATKQVIDRLNVLSSIKSEFQRAELEREIYQITNNYLSFSKEESDSDSRIKIVKIE